MKSEKKLNQYHELHSSPEIMERLGKCDSLVARSGKGMKGDRAKGAGKKAH